MALAPQGRSVQVSFAETAADDLDLGRINQVLAVTDPPGLVLLGRVLHEGQNEHLSFLDFVAPRGGSGFTYEVGRVDRAGTFKNWMGSHTVCERIKAGSTKTAFDIPDHGEMQPGAPQKDHRLAPGLPLAQWRFRGHLARLANFLRLRPVQEDDVRTRWPGPGRMRCAQPRPPGRRWRQEKL